TRVTDPRSRTRNSEFTTQMLPNAAVIPIGPAPVRTCWRIGSVVAPDGADTSDDDAAPPHATASASMTVAARVPHRRAILDRCTRGACRPVVLTARAAHGAPTRPRTASCAR